MARNTRKLIIVFSVFIAASFLEEDLYSAGSLSFHLIDTHRKEIYISDPHHPWRELMVRVWYPDQNIYIKSHAEQRYPLIIFSHGLGGLFNGDSYTSLCQVCADAGYIVAAISHSYACKPVQFSDGRITQYCSQLVMQRYLSGDEIILWQDDVTYFLDYCCFKAENKNSVLSMIDKDKIGIMGHSYGGALAIALCYKDLRIKAAINLDGPVRAVSKIQSYDKPLLFMIGAPLSHGTLLFSHPALVNDAQWSYTMYSQEIFFIDALIPHMQADFYKIIIDGVRHTSFSNEIFNQQTALDNVLIDKFTAHTIISTGCIKFFDKYIKGIDGVVLDELSVLYSNVKIEKKIDNVY